MIVLPRWGWRAVFFVGILPAFLTLWVRRPRRGAEDLARRAHAVAARFARATIFSGGLARLTIPLTIMNAFTLFGWWGFNLWLPGYLSLPVASGGIGFSATTMSWFIIAMQVGMWFGYVTFGFVSDAFGRKRDLRHLHRHGRGVLILVYISIRASAGAAAARARSWRSSRPGTSAGSAP